MWASKKYKDYKFFAFCDVCFVLLDLGFAACFTSMAVIRARYLPRPLGRCENLAQLDNGGKNWLDVMVDPKSSTFKDRSGVCKSETHSWRLEIGLA